MSSFIDNDVHEDMDQAGPLPSSDAAVSGSSAQTQDNKHSDSTVRQTQAAATTATSNTIANINSHGPEIIDDNAGPPLFGTVLEAALDGRASVSSTHEKLPNEGAEKDPDKKEERRVEQTGNGSDDLQRLMSPGVAIWHDKKSHKTQDQLAKTKKGRVEQIDDTGPQMPPGMATGYNENCEARLDGNARAHDGTKKIHKTQDEVAKNGRVEQIDDTGPQMPPGMVTGHNEKREARLDGNAKAHSGTKKGRVEQIDDTGPQMPPGMVTGHNEKHEARLDGNARAGYPDPSIIMGAQDIEDRDGLCLADINSSSHPPVDDTQPSAAAVTTQSRLTSSTPGAYPQSTADTPTFYEVEATLVNESSRSQPDVKGQSRVQLPIYNAVHVPDESSLSWWKRKRVRYGILLVVIAVLAATVAIVVAVLVRKGGDTGNIPDKDDATSAIPSFPPPPFTCKASNLGTLYEIDCGTCILAMATHGNTTALFRAREEPPGINLLSESDGKKSFTSHISADYDVGTIAISYDVVVTGDPYFGDNRTGIVRVHERDFSGMWNEMMQIVPTNIEERATFGYSVSTDRGLLVIGAPNDGEYYDGSAFIYQRSESDSWVQVAKLAPEDQENIQNFGHAVAMKGNMVAVADNLYGSDGKGSVFVYQYGMSSDSTQWSLSDIIINDDCVGKFGNSLEITDDGNLVIGCPLDDSNTGAIYYYKQMDGEDPHSLRQKITPQEEGGVPINEFGDKLAVDGKFMAVGTYEEINGKVYIFMLDQDDYWKRVARIVAPSINHTHFGDSIELSGDSILISYWDNVYDYKLLCGGQEQNDNSFLANP